jgi:hypothetical protein
VAHGKLKPKGFPKQQGAQTGTVFSNQNGLAGLMAMLRILIGPTL